MKPITDDVVHALIRGVAAREKRRSAGQQSAEIIKFTGAQKKAKRPAPSRVAGRPTISGVFCYVSRLRNV